LFFGSAAIAVFGLSVGQDGAGLSKRSEERLVEQFVAQPTVETLDEGVLLCVRRRPGRKRALGTRAPMAIPQGPNQRWSLDLLSHAFIDGRRFQILAVVDDFTCECLTLVADTSLGGQRVVRELEAVIIHRGRPAICVSDNGTCSRSSR
jgi:transposase InsO family protein